MDASVTVARILLEQESRERVAGILRLIPRHHCHVPLMWQYEVRNSILVAERRGRISRLDGDSRFNQWNQLPFETDSAPDFDVAMALARRHGLSFYDAVYVELAVRLDAALATLDQAMMRAAEAEGVPVS